MLRQHFDFRSMNQAVRAETGERSRYGRPGNALVQEKGEDRFVEGSEMVLGVLIEKDGYFLCGSLRQHSRSPSSATTASRRRPRPTKLQYIPEPRYLLH